MTFPGPVAVLLSGGLDSASCVAYYRNRGNSVMGVFVDYGQPVAMRERASAQSIAEWYGISVTEVSASGDLAQPPGEIPGRNGLFVFAAIAVAGVTSGLLALGVHNGSPYYDCSPHFVTSLNTLVSGCAGGRLRVVAPFLDWTKREIWDYAKLAGVPLELTWACEVNSDVACNTCVSCIDLEALRAGA